MKLSNIKISHKLFIMTVAGLIVLSLFGFSAVNMGRGQLASLKEVYVNNLTPLDNLRNIQLILREVDYQMVGVISSAESSQKAASHLSEALKKLDSLWKKTESVLNAEELGGTIKDFKKQFAEFKKLAVELKKAYESDDIDTVDLVHEKWLDIKKAIFQSIDKMAEQQKQLVETFYQNKRKSISKVITTIGVVTIVSVICFIVFAMFIARSISRPVHLVMEASKEISKGDLTKRIDVNSSDEMGIMASTLNQMLGHLNTVFYKISENIRSISTQAVRVAEFSEELKENTSRQNRQVEQVASAATEMSQTIVDMAQNASSASESAKLSYDAAMKGKAVVGEVVDNIKGLADEISDASAKLETLGERSKEIGEILSVIQDIADQTNLLALNAAIEAARAGEQGRGFAVVADEVRKLAEKTAHATEEIAEKIVSVQKETDNTIVVMQRSTNAVSKSVEIARGAGDALQEIVSSSEQVMEMVQRIATATEQQSSAAEEVSQSMEHVADIVKHTSEQVYSLKALSDELLGIANTLKEQISCFVTNQNAEIECKLDPELLETDSAARVHVVTA